MDGIFQVQQEGQEYKEGAALVGTFLDAYVHIERVIWSKVPVAEIVGGEFAVLSVSLEELVHGELPKEIAEKSLFMKQLTTFTVKGKVPPLNLGKTYHMLGKLVFSVGYGYQYELVDFSSDVNLEDEEEFNHFLRATIGDSKTELLCQWFTNPLEILKEGDYDKLVAVKGLGETTAQRLLEKFREEAQNGLVYAKLAPFGLTKNQALKIAKKYGGIDAAKSALSTNPYTLIKDVEGYGWKKADEVAMAMGIDPCSEFRLRAYTEWVLKECADNGGHTWVTLDWLASACRSIAYHLTDVALQTMMREWIDEENPKYFLHYDRPTKRIGLAWMYQHENIIASHLIRLHHSTTKVYSNEEIEEAIKESEREVGFTYTEEQRDAIYSCLNNNVSIVVGSAGVGKSSIMRPITKLIRRSGQHFAQCSLSGKAASNLAEMTAEEGSTIHKLLRYNPKTGSFNADRAHQLNFDLIILDEISLVGVDIFIRLLEAIPDGCKLIMLGDSKQLESIGVGNLIKDIPGSNAVNSKVLVQIHRQAAKSGIITESMRISAGEKICSQYAINERRGELKDLKVITYTELPLTASTILEEYKDLYFNRHISPQDIMVILPMKEKGDASVAAINQEIQNIVNGIPSPDDRLVKKGNLVYTLRIDDKIIIKKNNYNAVRKDGEGNMVKEPIFNGNVGTYLGEETVPIRNDKGKLVNTPCLKVDLSIQGVVYVPQEEAGCVELGYAMTCHSAQGSGCPYVIVGLDMRSYALLSKEWVYTALTRAKKECILISQINALRKASEISRVSIKHTWLKELLIHKEEEFQKTGALPEVPSITLHSDSSLKLGGDSEDED